MFVVVVAVVVVVVDVTAVVAVAIVIVILMEYKYSPGQHGQSLLYQPVQQIQDTNIETDQNGLVTDITSMQLGQQEAEQVQNVDSVSGNFFNCY